MTDCSVSIIIPAYNVEKYLKDALDSIKDQVELPDEVILIDDGSSDGTLKIAKTFELPVPYRIVSIENGGQGNARNLGVKLASSEYVYFFDSDDLLTSNFIRSIKGQIRREQYPDIVLFSGESFNDSEYQGSRWLNYRRGFAGYFSEREQFLDKALLHGALFCSPCLYVSKKALWGPHALKFESSFFEDDALFYPLIFACRTYAVIDEVFFLRRNRDGSTMTMVPNSKHVDGAMICMETTLTLYSSKGLTSRERWHIRKRLNSHCVAYIVAARRAKLSVRVVDVISVIAKTRNPVLAIKALLYSLQADQSRTVRSIVGAVKRLGGSARS